MSVGAPGFVPRINKPCPGNPLASNSGAPAFVLVPFSLDGIFGAGAAPNGTASLGCSFVAMSASVSGCWTFVGVNIGATVATSWFACCSGLTELGLNCKGAFGAWGLLKNKFGCFKSAFIFRSG